MSLEIPLRLQQSIVFHVGFPKAASTTLQNMFEKHPRLCYLGNSHTFSLLVPQHPILWNGSRPRQVLTELASGVVDSGRVPVFSDERLIGNPHGGHYDALDIAYRIQALAPATRVIICIREQLSMLTSIYKQFVRAGGTRNVRDYFEAPWDTRRPHFFWEFYLYWPIIEFYQKLFGHERVTLLLLEELRDEPLSFFNRLYALLGVKDCEGLDLHEVHHRGMTDLEVAQRRLQNFFSEELISLRDPNPFSAMDVNAVLKNAIDERCEMLDAATVPSIGGQVESLFKGRFAESNQKLSKLLGVDLASYGYEVSGS